MSNLKEEQNELELFKSIHNYIKNKSQTLNNKENILIKYLKDPKIIKNNSSNNLSLFINELSKQIEKGNNIILPFIDPFYDLIDSYINCSNDDITKNFTDNKIFIQLMDNSFINRKNLIPIFAYFSDLYFCLDNKISISDEKMNDFQKYTNLLKMFYSYIGNRTRKNYPGSSFCFLGTGFELSGIDEIQENFFIKLRINFLKDSFLNYVKPDDDLISGEDIHIKYSILSLNKDISSIDLIIKFNDKKNKVIEIKINCKSSIENGGVCQSIKIKTKKIKILNNFYGQIKSMQITFYKNKEEEEKIFSQFICPYPLKENKEIFFSSEYNYFEKIDYSNQINDGENNPIYFDQINIKQKIEFRFVDINLVKVNYINYKENKFSMIDYFGGLKQFLPFLKIINGIYKNQSIIKINNIEKESFLFDFTENLLLIIMKIAINLDQKKQKESIELYWNFYLYILNKIEIFNSKNIKINIDKFSSIKIINQNIQIFFNIFIDFFNFFNNRGEDQELMIKKHIINFCTSKINLKIFKITNSQLYRNTMKQLFIYNRLWSKQNLFFKNNPNYYKNNSNNNLKIKYKRINYYTVNFQQPLIYPILEIGNYYPNFKKFDKEKLYKNPEDTPLKYNFSLDEFENILSNQIITNYLDNNNISLKYKCCLIKKMYHIKGELGISVIKNKTDFIIIFSSNKEVEEKCNKNSNDEKLYNSHLCYGSVFTCLQKDKNKLWFINGKDILFALIRIYFYRPSGLEIFTYDNKSYYFNFMEDYKNGMKFIEYYFSNFFKEIKIKGEKTLGWYNPIYSDILTPLFSERIDIWNEKKYYYSNFDTLMIINLFSNRSFNDLNQYPVFPMLYNEIKKQRIMKEPIGFQELTQESKERKEVIKNTYLYEVENEDEDNEAYFFSLFYSNITYTCNYLIRILPYSFIAIEYQGDGFDDPNRLFFSIKSTFYNTLNQRADLRELIPEMFYFSPLFKNINEVEFKKITKGNEIDNVIIEDWDESELKKYEFLKNIRNELEREKNLNQWIDLIFGKNMEFNENNERYYNKNNHISFEPDENIINDDLTMQSYDFGVLPLKLFDDPFPIRPKISNDIEKKIYNLNINKFNEDHINCLSNSKESFICKGEKGINNEYLKIIEQMKNNTYFLLNFGGFVNGFKKLFYSQNSNERNNINYLFTGDVYGNLSVYKEIKKLKTYPTNQDIYIEEISTDKILLNKIDDGNYELLQKLTDHTSEIQYIDYNPRLNLVIDYALDGYINIYTMPTLKLIRVIQTSDLNFNEKIKYLALISNPFPMICCAFLTRIFILDINGDVIRQINIEEDSKIKFCIDKNCGLFNDFISFNKNGKEEKILLPF